MPCSQVENLMIYNHYFIEKKNMAKVVWFCLSFIKFEVKMRNAIYSGQLER